VINPEKLAHLPAPPSRSPFEAKANLVAPRLERM
jgi:hypothetical protein